MLIKGKTIGQVIRDSLKIMHDINPIVGYGAPPLVVTDHTRLGRARVREHDAETLPGSTTGMLSAQAWIRRHVPS